MKDENEVSFNAYIRLMLFIAQQSSLFPQFAFKAKDCVSLAD